MFDFSEKSILETFREAGQPRPHIYIVTPKLLAGMNGDGEWLVTNTNGSEILRTRVFDKVLELLAPKIGEDDAQK